MAENISTQFKTEGQSAFPVANEEKDNSTASSAGEQTNAGQTGSPDQNNQQGKNQSGGVDDGKGKGYADLPEWKERERVWDRRFNEQEVRHTQEAQEFREGMDKTIADAVAAALAKAGVSPEAASAEIPEWFGSDDARVWKSYQTHTEQIIARAVEQALQKFNVKSESEQKAIDDATNFMNSEITAIEADQQLNPNGLKIDRNKLLKTAFDNKAVDTEGRWNYRLAFKLMKPEDIFQAKAAMQERKNIAGATTEGNRAATDNSQVATSKDFANPANRPW